MAIYDVSTYAELVQYAAEADSVVYVMDDIDITDEYPNGDMPALTVNGTIDGNGCTISNWYHNANWASNYINFGVNGVIKDMKLKNIYCQVQGSYAFAKNTAGKDSYYFENCEITGIILSGYFIRGDYVNNFLKHCSVNLLLKNDAGFSHIAQALNRNGRMDNSYVKIKSESTRSELFGGFMLNGGRDSYFEIETEHFFDDDTCSIIFENCVFDITTDVTFIFDIDATVPPSILRKSHAPHGVGIDKMHDVTEEHWLDAPYLKEQLGFNIVVEE